MELGLAQLAAAVDGVVVAGGEGDGSGQLRRVCTDSRAVTAGDVFVPLVAERDGHDFAAAAAERGAGAMLWSSPKDPPAGVAIVRCQDTAAGLTALGFWCRQQMAVPVVGITGSVGKTSTKDLAVAALATRRVAANERSFNNEIGVPLTLANADPGADVVIVEMGARGIGHIAYLTQIAPPRIGIVLNVGSAHVGEFGSREAIALAKAELVAALPDDGLAILNADDPAVRAMADATRARVQLVGTAPDADLRADDIALDPAGRAGFRVTTPAGAADVTLAVAGRHQVGNALAVIAAALEAGMPLPAIVTALATAGPVSRYRMEVSERADGVTIVNDAYNANPESMAAALAALETMGAGRRRIAVLGPMLELGVESDAAHADVGALVAAHGVDALVVVDPVAAPIGIGAQAAGSAAEVRYAADAEAAYADAVALVRPGDIVLVKSSNGAGLRFLGDRLRDTQPSDKEEETR